MRDSDVAGKNNRECALMSISRGNATPGLADPRFIEIRHVAMTCTCPFAVPSQISLSASIFPETYPRAGTSAIERS
ncbi:MAG: hypothetical protein OXE85_06725 [Roseovarius sp.]|nr:hypothetical protein [Roseovarius sp.]